MSSSYRGRISFTIFGQSHSPAIGVTIEGLPAGFRPDPEKLRSFLDRRAPGRNELVSARREADEPEFVSGLFRGAFCGTPVTVLLRNGDARPEAYAELEYRPRPGHGDYTNRARYDGAQDFTGGGHGSGRLTAPLCVVGGLCLQLLEREGIRVFSRIASLGGIRDRGELTAPVDGVLPTLDPERGEEMRARIRAAAAEGDSVGGVVECRVTGVPAGLGDPMLDGMENRIARLVFAIPGVKGIEFGNGFAAAELRGSENNDAFILRDGRVETETNRCGGILGGITTGMPLSFRAAIKPTPSVAKEQRTVDLRAGEEVTLSVGGRHDPCIVPRALPCLEAAAAVAVYDALLERGARGENE